MNRRSALIFYIAVLILLAVTTLAALYDGGYHSEGGVIAGIAFVSAITSLLPFFISMHLFKKHESNRVEKTSLKVWGLILYIFCFPIKIWIIVSNLMLLINGGNGWAFG